MFESDDYDQILSQLDLPETCSNTQDIRTDQQKPESNANKNRSDNARGPVNKCLTLNLPEKKSKTCSNTQDIRTDQQKPESNSNKNRSDNARGPVNKCLTLNLPEKKSKENIAYKSCINNPLVNIEVNSQISLKQSKRTLINSYFDHKSKRKFPGPAGLLNGALEESKEDDICHMELLSQDVDYSLSHVHKGIFESPLWIRLLEDTRCLTKVDTIKNIKQQALKGNLRCRKADAIAAYVESVDRSAVDPLIVLRDTTENIKCTLHRDAWVAFSPYIVSECCALVLHSPTVLTTGSAFKKHYLNITLNNIRALYSTAIINQEDQTFPPGFDKVYEEDYTIIKHEEENIGINCPTELADTSDFLDGLDGAFSDDVF